ncbi:inositol monophosphatase family protein [Oscillatoria sp. FACHB-1406]|uniref:inositol monophosphatase family protein n=1 Tax=Oscillatoria sp. FACHB-1406 TaxID=2692846 RepID=UPI001683ACBD|nr:inositol monophosphatase family protein [Oscillatoria sp. FACHB-1406]MBD2576410.1 inositol monophosphatase [Oscillatoria sp. FACHB-1406]
MANEFWDNILQLTRTTTEEIGKQLVKDFGQIQAVRKDDGSLVTQADKWADKALRDAIAAAFPEHGFLSEETIHVFPANDWCWIIDPIDGTTNFTRGLPIWGISLGLLYRGTPVFGAVYFPQIQQFFHGYWYGDSGLEGPTGAFLNNRPIHTSPDEPSLNHLFNLCARSTDVATRPFPCKMRLLGVASYNLLLVACGAALGGIEATPKIWDIAAVYAILQAAGGAWVSLSDEPIFPLQVGLDYGQHPYPTLATSRAELVPIFKPLVEQISQPKVTR